MSRSWIGQLTFSAAIRLRDPPQIHGIDCDDTAADPIGCSLESRHGAWHCGDFREMAAKLSGRPGPVVAASILDTFGSVLERSGGLPY